MVYTVTKIFGVDAVKTRIFKEKRDALEDIMVAIKLFVSDISEVEVIEKENEETYYIINRSEDPTDFIEFVLRRNDIR
jgi:hypothetical protein